jgi:hypothetical protein
MFPDSETMQHNKKPANIVKYTAKVIPLLRLLSSAFE